MSTLYLVATPIGNLDDLSPRALETLNAADRIACEDTRTSGKLLRHYGVRKPLLTFHQHNEHARLEQLMSHLDAGEEIALITDAGMPGISDPGFLASREAWRRGHTVRVIPGPDACTTALIASGLPSDRFHFEGFLPPKKGRSTRIKLLCAREETTVLFESPRRVSRLLAELETGAGAGRLAAVARELTKRFEEIDRAPLGELRKRWEERKTVKGECVVVLSGKKYSE